MNAPRPGVSLRWFHLRIRDLLALTLICAILAAWWSDRSRLRDEADRANELAATNRQKAEDYDQAIEELVRLSDTLAQMQGESPQRKWNRGILSRAEIVTLEMKTKGTSQHLAAPIVAGVVSKSLPANGLVEVNLGSDDGLKKGDTLKIARRGPNSAVQSIGSIRLIAVDKAIAVGASVPGPQGPVMAGDLVYGVAK